MPFTKKHTGLSSQHVSITVWFPGKPTCTLDSFLQESLSLQTLAPPHQVLDLDVERQGDFKVGLRLHLLWDYTRIPMVLNSHTLPLKARHFRLERLLKELGSLWWQVKRFVATEWGIEKNGIQQPGFSFFKSFSLKTFIAFVTLLRNTVSDVARDTAALWTGTKQTVAICERRSIVFIGSYQD